MGVDHLAFDLIQLRRSLMKQKEYAKLSDLIYRVVSTSSALIDLELARDRLGIVEDLSFADPLDREVEQDHRMASIMSSAFISALILYSRATQSSSRHRASAPIVAQYPIDKKVTHDQILALRNDAIAHFGFGDDLRDGVWAEEYLTLFISDRGALIHHHGVRSNYKENTVLDLLDLVDSAIPICRAIDTKRREQLNKEIGKLVEGDQKFLPILRIHQVNRTLPVEGASDWQTTVSPAMSR